MNGISFVFKSLILIAVASACAPTSVAQSALKAAPQFEDAELVDRAVRAEMARQGIVGAAVGLIRQGEIVYLQGYGLADREHRTPATTKTIFNWASNSKPLAAVAAMQLVEQGRLDLEADVRRYVPEYPDPGHVIRARHLLCHQSGIPHYANGRVVPNPELNPQTRPHTNPVYALDVFARSPLLFEPGAKASYSSYAYVLLSAVVERAGERPFTEQVAARIARPLNMTSLQLDTGAASADWVVGYVRNKAGKIVRADEEAHAWKVGAGGYKSNIEDFARWAQALIAGRLLKPETYKTMWTPQPWNDGTAAEWGLGFIVGEQNGLKVSHGGKQNETTSRLVIYPQAQHGIVVLCNAGYGDPSKITTAIYAALDD